MNLTTIKSNSIVEETINKSKFIAYSFCLQNFEQIEQDLNILRQKYPDATHICYAYRFLSTEKCVDDGEPQSTAGKPILECIKKQNYNNVLVVVVRYFGGIKLGAGGLVRAYGNMAQKVLVISGQKDMFDCKKISFQTPITENKKLANLSKIENIFECKIDYGEDIKISFYSPIYEYENVCKNIENLFGKSINFKVSEENYLI